ncbi:hypothetical protein Godav_016280 [Gossypium davidsonii]|uniref:Uncharacterized protein n=1 Tax=Gossypium davidsonii TaxID=34287 RepID=A0A7J8RQU8_GOSDV|nr:hypothetical protein [Gossypium davidsonii]
MFRRGTSSSNRGVRRIAVCRILTLIRILGFDRVAARIRKRKKVKTLCKKIMEMMILLTTAILTTIIMKAMILVVLKLLLGKIFWTWKLERGALGNQLLAA